MKDTVQVTPHAFTGRHMAIIMVTFFAVVVGVNLTMAVLARTSWTGLVVQNAYVASQHFNEETEKREAMRATGNALELKYASGKLAITLKDRTGLGIDVKRGTISLERGASSLNDVTYDIFCVKAACEAAVLLLPGVWHGEVQLQTASHGSWQQSIEITVGGP